MTDPIILKNFNLGGVADSKWLGAEGSMARMVNCDIHSTPGIVKPNQALKQEFTPDDFIKTIVVSSDENVYAFGSNNGKVWKRDSSGTWTHVGTVGDGVMNSIEYNGYIYYATQNNLGRIEVSNASSWTSPNDNWQTFTEQDPKFHPMKVLNLILWIGDGRRIASVDENHTWSDSALYKGLQDPYRIKSLGKIGTALLIGTYVDDYIHDTKIFQWNTFSKTFSSYDDIPEVGINAFLQTDNVILASAGVAGNIYFYNGQDLEDYKKIPGEYSIDKKSTIFPNAVANRQGLPLFAISDQEGRGAEVGVYSLGSHNRNYDHVLNLEHKLSFGDTEEKVEIGAMELIGGTLIVSWKKGNQYGIDVTDWENKATGVLETRVINPGRMELINIQRIIAAYVELPENTEIKLYRNVNYEGFQEYDTIVDTIRKIIDASLSEPIGVFQIKVELIPDGDNAPTLEELIIEPVQHG